MVGFLDTEDILAEVAGLIAAREPSLILGKSLFAHSMPAEAAIGALVKTQTGFMIDPETKINKGRFQVTLRGYDRATGIALARRLSLLLSFEGKVLAEGHLEIKSVRPISTPLVFQASVGNVVEISINFLVHYCVI